MMFDEYKYLKSFFITEKIDKMQDNKYCFLVNSKANKKLIKRCVEKAFPGVKVKSVNVINQKGKSKRSKKGIKGFRSDIRKALVTLSSGSIDYFNK